MVRGRARECSACLVAQLQHRRVKRHQCLRPRTCATTALSHTRTSSISLWFSNSAALRSSFDKAHRPAATVPKSGASAARPCFFGKTVQLPLPKCTAKVSSTALNLPFLPNRLQRSPASHTLARRFPTSFVPRFTFVFSTLPASYYGFPASCLHHHQRFCLYQLSRHEKG